VEEAGCAPGGLPARRGARRTRASAHPPPSSPPLSSYVAVRGYDAVKRVLNGEHVTAEVREGGEEGEGGRRAPPPSHHQRSSLSLSPQVEWPYAIRELLGPGSVSTTYHADHRKLRQTLAPAFAPRAVAAAVPHIASLLTGHIQSWIEAGPGLGGVAAAKAATFHVVLTVVMGFPPSWTTPAALADMSGLFEAWLQGFLPGRKHLAAGLAARKKIVAAIDAATSPGVAARRAMPADDRPPPASMMDRLADAVDADGVPLAADRLPTIALNLLFAGHETSAQTLTHLMRTLAARPDLMERLRREQAAVVAEHGPEVTASSLAAAPLAAACVREQLRTVPVVAQLFRKALAPLDVGNGVSVAAGEVVVLDLEHTMATDARWEGEAAGGPLDPASFAPDRWLSNSPDAKKEGAFLPFGSGARMCVGWTLANAELQAALALLARTAAWRVHAPGAPLARPPAPRLPVDGLVVTVERWGGWEE